MGSWAQAWNDAGHMTIARVAWERLSPAARSAATALLAAHPGYERDLLAEMPGDWTDRALYVFERAATWPDMLRDPKHPMHAMHRSNWHYVNFPLVATENAAEMHPPPPQVDQLYNVVAAINKARADLADTSLSPADRAMALCWIEHLLGDSHQPMHSVSFFSKQFPDGDRGGTTFWVKLAGEPIKLHMLWDDLLGLPRAPRAIELMARDLLADPALTPEALARPLQRRDVLEWIAESRADARDITYLSGRLRGAASDERTGAPPAASKVPALPFGYEPVARAAARKRAVLAGTRLADLLNQTLAPSTSVDRPAAIVDRPAATPPAQGQ